MESGKKSLKSYPIAKARTAVEKKKYAERDEKIEDCNEVVPSEEMIPEKMAGDGMAEAWVKKEEKRSQKQV